MNGVDPNYGMVILSQDIPNDASSKRQGLPKLKLLLLDVLVVDGSNGTFCFSIMMWRRLLLNCHPIILFDLL